MYTSKYLEYLKEVFKDNIEILNACNNCSGTEIEEIFNLVNFIDLHKEKSISFTMPNSFNKKIKIELLLSDMTEQEKEDFNNKYYIQ